MKASLTTFAWSRSISIPGIQDITCSNSTLATVPGGERSNSTMCASQGRTVSGGPHSCTQRFLSKGRLRNSRGGYVTKPPEVRPRARYGTLRCA